MGYYGGMETARTNGRREESERRALPFFVEFVKFSTGFAVLIAVALITLRFASAAV